MARANATASFSVGGRLFDHGQVHAYVEWARCNGLLPAECAQSFRVFDDCGCWADAPSAGEGVALLQPYGVFGNDDDAGATSQWTDPVTDAARWVEAASADSLEFLGFQPTLIDYGGPTTSRGSIALIRGGAVAGQTNRAARTIRIVGTLYATTPRGLAYGRRWLMDDLSQACGSTPVAGGCTGTTARMRTECPLPGQPRGTGIVDLVDMWLMAGPKPQAVTRGRNPCFDTMEDVELILASGRPHLYALRQSSTPDVDATNWITDITQFLPCALGVTVDDPCIDGLALTTTIREAAPYAPGISTGDTRTDAPSAPGLPGGGRGPAPQAEG